MNKKKRQERAVDRLMTDLNIEIESFLKVSVADKVPDRILSLKTLIDSTMRNHGGDFTEVRLDCRKLIDKARVHVIKILKQGGK